MPRATSSTNVIATVGIDIGKNAFHVIGLDDKGAIILRHKLSRGQVYARLANIPPCLIGMEACVGAHHLGRHLSALGHDARLMPARYVRPYSKGQKNDFRDAAETVFAALVGPAGGQVFLDVPQPNGAAVALATAHKFAPVFETARMYSGQIRPVSLERVFGVTTFELG